MMVMMDFIIYTAFNTNQSNNEALILILTLPITPYLAQNKTRFLLF